MIGNCDCCDRHDVPVSKVNYPGEPMACFLCQGNTDPDPYGEMDDPVGQAIRAVFASLDELIALAADQQTRKAICTEKIALGQMRSRCELLLSFALADQQPAFKGYRRHG